MASRDNQTLQGVVIGLVLLLILLIVGLLLINNERKKQEARADTAVQDAQSQRQAAGSAQSEANRFKEMMGFKEEDTQDTVQKSFEEDMTKYGSTFDESVRYYSPLLQNLQQENHKLAQSEATAKSNVKDLDEQLKALKAEKDKQFAEYDQKYKQLQEDAAGERTKFEKQRQDLIAEQNKLSEQLAQQRQEVDKARSDLSSAGKKQADQLAKLDRDITLLRSNQLDPDPFAQPADGLVRWVNQKDQKVWINLGEEDHLRPQVTFMVYSGDESDALKADSKGSIEVTKILSPHMAEARVTSDIPTRPLMEGDKIYSQVWNRGRQVGFAIAGTVDINGDGKSDIEELKRIIALNNGKVDALPGKGGEVDGEMTVDTRYLILGTFPESTMKESVDQQQAWAKMTKSADRLGIETISLDEFLNLMGWKVELRTVALGNSARAEDFPFEAKGDYAPPRNQYSPGTFRPRKPQPTY
ncbi:hypothetical protein [Bythopirellula polymerisocia]|uniref:Uncharacterized protein n=1 Tax=Bythopirellula polymerisocia TaxID=2528003 RepID=A0A5C6CQY4_9BACT|nr:hypothetical protein [Bythopirellula polymerisocia]TWU27333.1 hypothetical protein Pla144_21050 [Bythopirellula polymerisocia]